MQTRSFMLDVLITHIRQKVDLTDPQAAALQSFFSLRKLRRKQYLLQEGEVCRTLAFVNSGLLKSYLLDDKGTERINLFAFEGWWISDFSSFLKAEKAVLNIDAVQDSELLLITLEDYERLTLEIPVMDRYFRLLYQNSLVTKDYRLIVHNNFTAEEKYLDLLQNQPEMAKKLSHSLIASYLGLSPETVSRIRKKITLR